MAARREVDLVREYLIYAYLIHVMAEINTFGKLLDEACDAMLKNWKTLKSPYKHYVSYADAYRGECDIKGVHYPESIRKEALLRMDDFYILREHGGWWC